MSFSPDVDGCVYTATVGSVNVPATASVERTSAGSLLVRTRALPSGNPVNVAVNC